MASPSDQIEVTTSAEDEEEPQTMFVEEQHLHDDPVGQIEALQCSGNDDDHREELEEQLSDVEATEKQSNPGENSSIIRFQALTIMPWSQILKPKIKIS